MPLSRVKLRARAHTRAAYNTIYYTSVIAAPSLQRRRWYRLARSRSPPDPYRWSIPPPPPPMSKLARDLLTRRPRHPPSFSQRHRRAASSYRDTVSRLRRLTSTFTPRAATTASTHVRETTRTCVYTRWYHERTREQYTAVEGGGGSKSLLVAFTHPTAGIVMLAYSRPLEGVAYLCGRHI